MFHLASSALRLRIVDNKSAPASFDAASLIALSRPLGLGLVNAKFRLLIDPSASCSSRTIDADYDCESDSTSSQSSGELNRQKDRIPEYPMRSRYESSRSGDSTILLSLVAIKTSATSDGSRS